MSSNGAREIWFLRHGQTDWNHLKRWQGHADIPLNADGLSQAGRTAARLHAVHFDGVYSSDLARASMTARLACPHAALVIDPRLRELRFGTFEGKRFEDMSDDEHALVSHWWKDPYASRLPGGETYTEMEERLVSWRDALPAEGRFLAVTHGGPIRCMIYETMGKPRNRAWTVHLDNCGLTRIVYEPGRTTVVSVNDCGHLSVGSSA